MSDRWSWLSLSKDMHGAGAHGMASSPAHVSESLLQLPRMPQAVLLTNGEATLHLPLLQGPQHLWATLKGFGYPVTSSGVIPSPRPWCKARSVLKDFTFSLCPRLLGVSPGPGNVLPDKSVCFPGDLGHQIV